MHWIRSEKGINGQETVQFIQGRMFIARSLLHSLSFTHRANLYPFNLNKYINIYIYIHIILITSVITFFDKQMDTRAGGGRETKKL